MKSEPLCRLCLEISPDFIDIYGTHEYLSGFQIIIHKLFSFWILSEDRTTIICQKCFKLTTEYHLFYEMVLKNQTKFHSKCLDDIESSHDIELVKNQDIPASKIQYTNDTISKIDDNIDETIPIKTKNNDGHSPNPVGDEEHQNYIDESTEIQNKTCEVKLKKSKQKKLSLENDLYPNELIKNGKFIIKRKLLENMASTFYNLQCNICNETKTFHRLADYLNHFTSVHNGKGYVNCCNTKLFRRDLIYMHMAQHIQPSAFECPICKKKLARLHTLKHHLETHLPEVERSYKCDQCDRSYVNRSGLNYHKSVSHVPMSQRSLYKCEQCSKSFHSSSSYSSHVSTIHSGPKYLCSECGRNFKIKRNYMDHLQIHDKEGKNRIQCQICGFICKNRGSFKYHMKLHCKERFNCTICDYSTHRKTFLNQHLKIKHTDSKPHTCDICGKKFKLKSSLRNHIPQHTGERRFCCPYCPTRFTASSNYYTHLRKAHYEEHKANLNKKHSDYILPINTEEAATENLHTESLAREKLKQLSEKRSK